MDSAKAEVRAFNAFPRAHWRKILSTNPLERLNKEIKRRARVVGIFACDAAVTASSAPSWPTPTTYGFTDERRYFSEGSLTLLYPQRDTQPVAAITGGA